MAFGFPATYFELTPLNNLFQSAFIVNAVKICEKLNWTILTVDENELTAVSNNNKNTWDETISISFDDNAVVIKSASNGNQFYDRGRNKKNTNAFLELYFEEIKNNAALNTDENFLEEIKTTQENLSEKEQKNITAFYSVFSVFIPTKDYFITPVLIYLNILVFISMTFSGVPFFTPKTQDLIDWGGNYGPLVFENQSWRLLSSCFIHIGFFHLITNCIALAYVGLLLESYLKKWGFLITYLFCGIIASLSSLYWNKDVVSAGASGAIFGMYGILLVALLFKVLKNNINLKLIINIAVLIFINLCYSFKDGIDGAAHIGGFVTGILFGFALGISGKKRNYGMSFITASASILILCLYFNFKKSQVYIYQVIEYQEKIKEFTAMEKMALEAYSVQYGTSSERRESTLYMIQDRGIYYWNENITLVSELDKLYLPKEIHEENKKMIEYCKLRISLYEMAYKKIAENSTLYDEKMLELEFKIASVMNEIKKARAKN